MYVHHSIILSCSSTLLSPLLVASFPLEGKNQACKVGCVPHLVVLLGDSDPSVRAQAAGAIMRFLLQQ